MKRNKWMRENGDLPKGVMAFGNGGDRTETTSINRMMFVIVLV